MKLSDFMCAPVNRKTLFLRGIERTLTNMGVICPDCVHQFRRTFAYDFLELMKHFENDTKLNTYENSLKKYRDDAAIDRYFMERR